MRRTVTPLTTKRAYQAIRIVAKAIIDGDMFLSYSELAHRLGMPNETGRGLGPILDEAALKCREAKLPDISAVIVTKASLGTDCPMPSDDSFNAEGYWPLTGLHKSEVPAEQAKVQAFDWRSVRALGLRSHGDRS